MKKFFSKNIILIFGLLLIVFGIAIFLIEINVCSIIKTLWEVVKSNLKYILSCVLILIGIVLIYMYQKDSILINKKKSNKLLELRNKKEREILENIYLKEIDTTSDGSDRIYHFVIKDIGLNPKDDVDKKFFLNIIHFLENDEMINRTKYPKSITIEGVDYPANDRWMASMTSRGIDRLFQLYNKEKESKIFNKSTLKSIFLIIVGAIIGLII